MIAANLRHAGRWHVLGQLAKHAAKVKMNKAAVKATWKLWEAPTTVISQGQIINVSKPKISDADIMKILEELHG